MRPTVYGIRNCDTIKKARAWLYANGFDHDFHDYKAQGVDADRLRAWVGETGWERLINRTGTTFRKLPDAEKEGLDESKALRLMLSQPSMIKRPVIETGRDLLIGFDEGRYRAVFGR